MIAYFVFLGVCALVVSYLAGTWIHDIRMEHLRVRQQNDMLQVWSEAVESVSEDSWKWLKSANARRKRVERQLRRARAFGQSMHRNNVNRLTDINNLLNEIRRLTIENEKLTKQHRALVADVVGEVLSAQDRETVTKGLTRKL